MKPRFGFGFRTFITEKILHLGYMIEYINKSLLRCDAKKRVNSFFQKVHQLQKKVLIENGKCDFLILSIVIIIIQTLCTPIN